MLRNGRAQVGFGPKAVQAPMFAGKPKHQIQSLSAPLGAKSWAAPTRPPTSTHNTRKRSGLAPARRFPSLFRYGPGHFCRGISKWGPPGDAPQVWARSTGGDCRRMWHELASHNSDLDECLRHAHDLTPRSHVLATKDAGGTDVRLSSNCGRPLPADLFARSRLGCVAPGMYIIYHAPRLRNSGMMFFTFGAQQQTQELLEATRLPPLLKVQALEQPC